MRRKEQIWGAILLLVRLLLMLTAIASAIEIIIAS